MRAAVWSKAQQMVNESKPNPERSPSWTIVRPAYVGICGTDLHIWEGHHPRSEPGLTIGHEFVGESIESTSAGPAGTRVFVNPLMRCGRCESCVSGRDVVCGQVRLIGVDRDGGAADEVAVPEANLVPLPEGAPLRSFALVEPLSVCVRAVRRSGQRLGDSVKVVGAGPIGLMVALCARRAGASSVVVRESNPTRAEMAADLGFAVTDGHERYDLVYDCTGHPSVARSVLESVRAGGTLMDVGLYREPTTVDLPSLMRRELTIRGTHVYGYDDVQSAIELIAAGAVPVEQLISATYPLDETQRAFESVAGGHEIKALLTVRDA